MKLTFVLRIAGTEMNNIKFIKPVYPEDELHTIIVVINFP